MKAKLNVAQFGLGPIGLETVKELANRSWAAVLGAVDTDPQKKRRDLGQLTNVKGLRGLRVHASLSELLAFAKPDLIFHTAVSRFAAAHEDLACMARAGIDVVSSCEQLVFPRLSAPRLAERLDQLCRRTGSRIVAAGVNPGFVMDLLPLCLSSMCRRLTALHIERVVNASSRREPLQRKIGSGLAPAEFRALIREERVGHTGLKESLALVAHSLGWKIDSIRQTAEPVLARRMIRTQFVTVRKGQVCGVHQRAEARIDGKLRLSLDLQMYLEAPKPRDVIAIEGEPPIRLIIPGGLQGDPATVGALVNTAPRLLQAPPGLLLPTELPLPRFGV